MEGVELRSRPLVDQLRKLVDVGTMLSAEQDLGKLLGLILRESRALTGADAGAVFVREDEVTVNPNATGRDRIHTVTPILALRIAQNDSVEFPFREMRLPFDTRTISGHVAHTGQVVNLADAYRIPPGAPYSYSPAFDQISGYRCRSMIAVPMRNRGGETIGVIELINKKRDPGARLDDRARVEEQAVPFDEVDAELLLALASQAAVCVEKAKLYEEIERMFEGLVASFTVALERRNRTTYGHCMRVARYAVAIAEAINAEPPETFGGVRFSPVQLRELRYAALLHDIGKIAVPEAILDKENKLLDAEVRAIEYRLHYAQATGKPAARMREFAEFIRRVNVPRGMTGEDRRKLDEIRAERFRDVDGEEKPLLTDAEYEDLAVARGNLTAAERRVIERHIVDTWEILKRIPWPRDFRAVPNIAACHHEKADGSGYPWGLRGEEIPLGGRILAIVDIFEALTAKDRPYKPAIPVDQAIAIVEAEVRRGALDARIWRLFLDRKLHTLFMGDTGFIERPSEPQLPASGRYET